MRAGKTNARGIGVVLAVVMLWAALPGAAQAAKRVALVVGNGAYEHVQRLPNPGNDARAMGDAFERLGYSVTRLEDAGYDELRRELATFKRTARASEAAVVFYAGHGIEVKGSNYLVPVDAKLAHSDDVEDEAMPLGRAMGAVGGAQRLGLAVLDACRDNPFVKSMTGETRNIGRGLARVEPGGVMMVAYAAKHGQLAGDGDGEHSPYTEALLKYLKEEPGLEVRKLFGKVRDEVVATAKRKGRKQEPFVYESLGGATSTWPRRPRCRWWWPEATLTKPPCRPRRRPVARRGPTRRRSGRAPSAPSRASSSIFRTASRRGLRGTG